MAAINRYDGSSDSPPPAKGAADYGKEEYGSDTVNIADPLDDETHHHLHRGLKARQITMIAIGGAIGTGLIIGTYVTQYSQHFAGQFSGL